MVSKILNSGETGLYGFLIPPLHSPRSPRYLLLEEVALISERLCNGPPVKTKILGYVALNSQPSGRAFPNT